MLYALILLLVIFVVGYIIGWWLKRSNAPAPVRASANNTDAERWYPDAPDSSGTVAHRTRARVAAAANPEPAPAAEEKSAPEPMPLVQEAPAKKEPAKKTPAKQTPAKQTTAKKSPEKKTKPAPKPVKPTKPKPKPSGKDELQRISGIGPKIDGQLKAMKITTFAQIAAWKKADMDKVNEQLKFKGRIEREDWVKQAKALAKGGVEEYVRVFGKNPR